MNDEKVDFHKLKYYDLVTKQFTDLTASIKWGIDDMEINKARSQIIFKTNEGRLF